MSDPTGPNKPTRLQRVAYSEAVKKAAITKTNIQTMIAQYWADREPFTEYLKRLGAEFGGVHGGVQDTQVARMAFREIGRMLEGAEKEEYIELRAALSVFKVEKAVQRNAKHNFLVENSMTKAYRDNPDQAIYGSPFVEKKFASKLRTSFPPLGKWICDSDDIRKLWEYHLAYDPQSDNRLPRHSPIVIADKDMKLVVKEDESVIVRDPGANNEIVLVVLRCVVSDPDAMTWLDGIIEEATSTRRCCRVRQFRQ